MRILLSRSLSTPSIRHEKGTDYRILTQGSRCSMRKSKCAKYKHNSVRQENQTLSGTSQLRHIIYYLHTNNICYILVKIYVQ